jgi:hypothetical protein
MIEYNCYSNCTPEQIKQDLLGQGYQPIEDYDSPDFVYEPHSHPETNIIVVLTGEMDVTVGEEHGILKAGDKVTFPPNAIHSAKVGPKGCGYFWVQLK